MNWFTAIRPLAKVSRELRLIRVALTRLADAAERAYPSPTAVPEADEPPAEVGNAPTDFGRLYELESALRQQLGRTPDPEEVLRAYDDEAVVLRGRRE